MLKILTIFDIHASHLKIGARIDNYEHTWKRKLSFCLQKAIDLNVKVIILTGDLYHEKHEYKISSTTTIAFLNFCTIAAKNGIDICLVPGNHDMVYHNPDIRNRPIWILNQKDNVNFVNLKPFKITENGINLSITGSAYIHGGDDPDWSKKTQYFAEEQNSDFHIHVTHGSLVPQSLSKAFWAFDHTCAETLLAMNPNWDINFNGHIHSDFGEEAIIGLNGKYCINFGSLTRGSLDYENLKRKPSVCLTTLVKENDKVTPNFQRIYIPIEPAEKIFNVGSYLKTKSSDKEIKEFIENLSTSSLSNSLTTHSIIKHIKEQDLEEEIKNLAIKYFTEDVDN